MSSVTNLSLSPPSLRFTPSDDMTPDDLAWVKAIQELVEFPSVDSLTQLEGFAQMNVGSSRCILLKERVLAFFKGQETLDAIVRIAENILPPKQQDSLPAPRTPGSKPRVARINTNTKGTPGTISEHPSREASKEASPASASIPTDHEPTISPLTLPK